MGKRTQGGWTIRIPAGANRSVYVVRFRHNGQRVSKSTGCANPDEASVEAARIYAEVVGGRRVARPASGDFAATVADYLADFELETSPEWSAIVTIYFRAHLIPFFGSFEAFTLASYGDYGRMRLQKVTRPTVRKELSALRRFVAWCAEHDRILPPVPSLPKHGQPGKRAKNARKRKATVFTADEAARILAAMPERSQRTGHWIRPLFTVLWETGLRPTSVLKLETPLHYRKGADVIFISREIDKEGFERTLPISHAAQAALDLAVPAVPGRIFLAPKGSLRVYLADALQAAGLTSRNISTYDFRHSRITVAANSPGPLTGASYLAGHKHASTTALYIHAGEEAARATLAAMSGDRSGDRSGKTKSKPKKKSG